MMMSTKCHYGNVKVFSSKDVEVWGGGVSRGVSVVGMDYVFDLAGKAVYKWQFPAEFTNLQTVLPKIISLYIDDNQAPYEYNIDFWKAMWKDLHQLERKGGKKLKVLFCCLGGHGRTGTVLTALALAANMSHKGDLLKELREVYCQEMVESKTQLDYLRELGLVTNEVHSNKPIVHGKTPFSTSNKTETKDDGYGLADKDGNVYNSLDVKKMSDSEYMLKFGYLFGE